MQSNGASQEKLNRDVKEDIKKISFTMLNNFSNNQSLEGQIYGLSRHLSG